jgi:hypothetical protein
MPDETKLMHLINRLHRDLVQRGRHVLDYAGVCQTCREAVTLLRRKQAA